MKNLEGLPSVNVIAEHILLPIVLTMGTKKV